VSSTRKNAEFVGEVTARSNSRLSYHSVKFDISPPKRGEEWSKDWKFDADEVIEKVGDLL
jgi:hypothetical protein